MPPTATDDHRPPRHPWLPAALAAALAVLLYAHTLGGTWVYDDLFHAQKDPRLAEVANWSRYFTEAYYPGGADRIWRPLVSLSYAVQFKLGGDSRAWPFHLVNVLLHAGASALVAELARRLTGRAAVATIAGLLFAAHPVHVEAVAYIVGRAESACAVGVLGALVLFLRPLTRARALAVFACFCVAILSKEQGLLLPAMLLALWPLRRGLIDTQARAAERPAARLLLLLTLFTLSAYIVYREQTFHWWWEANLLDYGTQPMIHSTGRDRALIPFALLGRAAAIFLAPVKLAPEYGLAVITSKQELTDPYLYAGGVVLLVVVIVAIAMLRRRAWAPLFLLFAAALTYFMVANVVLIGVVFAERLLYLPSAFLLILVAMALSRFPRGLATVVTVGLVVAMGVRTFTYAARWNDRLAFYEQSLRESPRATRLRVLLAEELFTTGQWDRARKIIHDGLAVAPDYWKLWADAARIAAEQGRFAQAKSYIDEAWNLKGYIPELLYLQDVLSERRATTRPTTRPK